MFLVGLVFVILTFFGEGETCTCLPGHPQAHYCQSDYVLLVKVINSTIVHNDHGGDRTFEVKIKNSFKANEKINLVMKNGLIWTPKYDSMCGVNLKVDGKYLVTGKIENGKATINTCNYHEEWSNLTPKQRKGFKLLYKLGCECKIAHCPLTRRAPNCVVNSNTCAWNTAWDRDGDCQKGYSICMRQETGHCQWNTSRAYKQCLKERELKKKERQRLEP